jgi:hypothetical protein
VYVYNIFFIHSSIDRHLGWFHIVIVVNTCIMNMGMQLSLWHSDFIFFGLLVHMLALFLILWGNTILFSIMTALIYIPTNSGQGLTFLHILSSTWYICLLIPESFSKIISFLAAWFTQRSSQILMCTWSTWGSS